jgi:sulfur transfer complex TusBCD TusB component (DsrH family)
MTKTLPDTFQAYVKANEAVYQTQDNIIAALEKQITYSKALEEQVATLEEMVQTQKELIEVYQREAGDAEKEIEQQRLTIQSLQDKLAEHK